MFIKLGHFDSFFSLNNMDASVISVCMSNNAVKNANTFINPLK